MFDQIVDGTKWSTVNTKEDYADGLSSYYEIIVIAQMKTLCVCLARNEHTGSASPFISAVELQSLEDSVYNSTDFGKYGLATVARNNFGYDGDTIRQGVSGLIASGLDWTGLVVGLLGPGYIVWPFVLLRTKLWISGSSVLSHSTMAHGKAILHRLKGRDDQFNRFWQPFTDNNPVVVCQSNAAPSHFWNIPPSKALSTALTTSRGKTLTIKWPPFALPEGDYYDFYNDINVTTNGVTVYTGQRLLSGQTEIVLTPKNDSPVGPVINAGEILQTFPLGRRNLTRDGILNFFISLWQYLDQGLVEIKKMEMEKLENPTVQDCQIH
ncbi:hypothetical protein Acr_07g0002100 [Actinidia rufa]|uniref:Malectin-like domain-containing protein n=1 Tax=Actinidia rufa TaxID=165716 RepID=A0A7J0EUC3_9ERIC|nr:hypothetical protein Acr_07g0002100 [Actinidia rufa]